MWVRAEARTGGHANLIDVVIHERYGPCGVWCVSFIGSLVLIMFQSIAFLLWQIWVEYTAVADNNP